MNPDFTAPNASWHWYEKIAFRFFFILFLIHTEPWGWPGLLPGVGEYLGLVIKPYYNFTEWLTTLVKKHYLHTDIVIEPNGSGDTLDSWVFYGISLVLSFLGMIIWTVLDRRRTQYIVLHTWLQVIVRYYLAMMMFVYGFVKLFPIQMPSPSLSQLLTPLGEFSHMRLAWLFIGSSSSYEIFSGICELLGGLLMLSRRTTAVGALVLVAVLGHVVALNYFFDIPVKLYSTLLLVLAVYLLTPHIRQFWAFFIRHIPVKLTIPKLGLSKKWHFQVRILLKLVFITAFCLWPFYQSLDLYNAGGYAGKKKGVFEGLYDVERFQVNGKEVTRMSKDTIRWYNVVFETNNSGSIRSRLQTGSALRYGRDYFSYEADTSLKVMKIKFHRDSVRNFSVAYSHPDTAHILLSGIRGSDSLHVTLRKESIEHFLLTKPINWVQNSVP